MKTISSRQLLLTMAALLWIGLAGYPAQGAESSDASDRYLDYLAFVPQAEALLDLAPYRAEWWGKRMAGKSEDEQRAGLERVKKSVSDYQNVDVIDVSVSKKRAVVKLSATWDDFPMHGIVTMILEGGSWRVDEEMWATGE